MTRVSHLVLFTVLLATVSLTACSYTYEPSKPEVIKGLVRIFMHDRLHWSVMVQNEPGGPLTVRYLSLNCCGCREAYPQLEDDVVLVPDVGSGEKMWVQVTMMRSTEQVGCEKSSWPEICQLQFHVRSEKDVGGGDWNHGKNGHGRTNVVR